MQTHPSIDSSTITSKNIAKLIAASIVIDLIQAGLDLIPIIGWIINLGVDFIAWLFFYLWFKRLGVNFNNFKRFLYFNSGFILDMVPFINTFAWTIDILMVLSTLKRESAEFDHTRADN